MCALRRIGVGSVRPVHGGGVRDLASGREGRSAAMALRRSSLGGTAHLNPVVTVTRINANLAASRLPSIPTLGNPIIEDGEVELGERAWFVQLYRDSYKSAFAYARKLVGQADAEDVVQETFLRLAKYKHASREGVSKSFVLKMTRNVAFSALGNRIRDRERCTVVQGQAPSATGDSARSGRGGRDERPGPDLASKYLEQLSEGQREAIVLTEILGLSEAQAGLAMEISRPVVNAKRSRAVELLRSRVAVDHAELGK